MQSTVHLFNTALARLGGDQLALNISPQEQNVEGQICVNLFPHVLDMALGAHAWAFATRRIVLAAPVLQAATANPAYPFAFDLPADCLKPIQLEGYAGVNRTPSFVIEGNTLRCGLERATLVYVARVTDPKQWPPQFADALAWAMAGELASAVIHDPQKQNWCYQNYMIALASAIAQDQTNQNPLRKQSEWTATRFEGDY
jgi:hypothetical protein